MKKTTSLLLAASGFIALVAALIISLAQEAHAPGAAPVLVTNTAANPVPTTVSNAASSPVLVRDVDSTPYSASCIGNVANGGQCFFTVPSGKRLVIESVSGQANMVPGQLLLIRIEGSQASGQAPESSSTGFSLTVPVSFQFSNGFFDFYGFNQRTFLQVDPEGIVRTAMVGTTAGSSQATVNLSGRLVSAP